jgi:hypothetical protein
MVVGGRSANDLSLRSAADRRHHPKIPTRLHIGWGRSE